MKIKIYNNPLKKVIKNNKYNLIKRMILSKVHIQFNLMKYLIKMNYLIIKNQQNI
jgi:hypothetical protein